MKTDYRELCNYNQRAIRTREIISNKYANIKRRAYRDMGYLPSLSWDAHDKLTFHECMLWNNVHLSYLVNICQLMVCKGLDTERDNDMDEHYSYLNMAVNAIDLPLVDYARKIRHCASFLFMYFGHVSKFHDMIKNKVVNIFEMAGRKVKGLLCNDFPTLREHMETVCIAIHKLSKLDNLKNNKIPLLTKEHEGFPDDKALVLAYYSWGRAQGISMDFQTYYQYHPKA